MASPSASASASAIKKVSVITQIVRLKHAVNRWKNKSLTRRSALGYSSSSDSDDPTSPRRRIPSGSVAVYVGPERCRFVVPTRFLNLPVFVALLDQAEEEFGYQPAGGLALPCEAGFFTDVLRILGEDEERFGSMGLDEFRKIVSEVDFESSSSFAPLLHNTRVSN